MESPLGPDHIHRIFQLLIGGKAPKMIGISKFSGHIFAPSSQQSAGIALKTSPIESYQFSTSKLCTNFFSNSNTKIIFFGLKKKI